MEGMGARRWGGWGLGWTWKWVLKKESEQENLKWHEIKQ